MAPIRNSSSHSRLEPEQKSPHFNERDEVADGGLKCSPATVGSAASQVRSFPSQLTRSPTFALRDLLTRLTSQSTYSHVEDTARVSWRRHAALSMAQKLLWYFVEGVAPSLKNAPHWIFRSIYEARRMHYGERLL